MPALLRLGGRPRTWRLLAGGLFLAVFALQWAGSEPLAFWGALYAVPIVIVGRREDSVTGLLAGVVAVALAVAAALLGDVSPSAGDYIALALAFPIAGWVAGAPGERGSETTRQGLGRGAAPSVAGALSDDREERRREALKLVDLGTWELDLASGEIQWSVEYQDLYGVDPGVFIASARRFRRSCIPRTGRCSRPRSGRSPATAPQWRSAIASSDRAMAPSAVSAATSTARPMRPAGRSACSAPARTSRIS